MFSSVDLSPTHIDYLFKSNSNNILLIFHVRDLLCQLHFLYNWKTFWIFDRKKIFEKIQFQGPTNEMYLFIEYNRAIYII